MADLLQLTQNRLLNMLEAKGQHAFISQLQLINLLQGEVLYETGSTLVYSYFPITAVISTVYQSSTDISLETEAIRSDGMFGLPQMIDNQLASRAIVQNTGYAYRIKTSALEEEIKRSNELLQVLLMYMQLRTVKIAQISVCSRHHSIEQQLCRVLLNALDYSPTNSIAITQHTIAEKLNVRRESITLIAGNLQREGIIQLKRGKIIVLNRRALEAKTCECYYVIANVANSLLKVPNVPASNQFINSDKPIHNYRNLISAGRLLST
jgi:CRP-like cAMP-binding protein